MAYVRAPPSHVTAAHDLAAAPLAALRAPRVVIEHVTPSVDQGRYPARAVVGQYVPVEADVFLDGHEQPGARLIWWSPADSVEHTAPMSALGNDRWRASFTPELPGLHYYTVEGWLDVWGSYLSDLRKNASAGVATALDVREGSERLRSALTRTDGSERAQLAEWLTLLGGSDVAPALDLLLSPALDELMGHSGERRFVMRYAPELPLDVERSAAAFASWYQLFPRSLGRAPGEHGTFDDVVTRLPALRAMGFDVLYLPPIHPIGTSYRKGRNNALEAEPADPGSPYAIGTVEGGHEAVHPRLGGIDAFRRLVGAAAAHGMEIALDFAAHGSRDHPWLAEHPGWFSWRPDGSIRFAENPPKKYEDIINFDFYTEDAKPALWLALRDLVEGWVSDGVNIFRVDNPHTKPLPFWEWLIASVRARHPQVLFLAEAFTRPAMMYRLAKIGFSQSYTYYTWRNSKRELTEYFTELTSEPLRDFFRPHLFVNTPDINPRFLQSSGRAGFLIRAALATTLSGLWGLYSGFELCEAEALPGREEYLDSEKYQLRQRNWNAPGNIIREITRLNHIRHANPALHTHLQLKFYNALNEQVIYYGKSTPDRSNFILVAVSLDPHNVQETMFEAPLWEFGLSDFGALEVEELMSGTRFIWHGKLQHWRFVPQELPFAVFRIQPHLGA